MVKLDPTGQTIRYSVLLGGAYDDEAQAIAVDAAGNAYLTHFEEVWEKVSECALVSALDGVECAFTPEHPGLHRITATIADTLGRAHSTTISRWTAGKGEMVWESEANNSLRIIPEKKR